MKIVSITELNHKKSKITLQDGTVFALYKGEIRRLHLSEGMSEGSPPPAIPST